MCVGVCLGWGFETALISTTVQEQQPRSHHKGATSMQTHQAVRVGFELAINGIQFYVFATSRLRHPIQLHKVFTCEYHLNSLRNPKFLNIYNLQTSAERNIHFTHTLKKQGDTSQWQVHTSFHVNS